MCVQYTRTHTSATYPVLAKLIKWTASVSQIFFLSHKIMVSSPVLNIDVPQCPLMFSHTAAPVDSPLRLHNYWLKTCRWFSILEKKQISFLCVRLIPIRCDNLSLNKMNGGEKLGTSLKELDEFTRVLRLRPRGGKKKKKACVLYFRGKASTHQATALAAAAAAAPKKRDCAEQKKKQKRKESLKSIGAPVWVNNMIQCWIFHVLIYVQCVFHRLPIRNTIPFFFFSS